MTSSTATVQAAEQPSPAPQPAVDPALLSEITAFRDDCTRRYGFNNRWDTALTTVGILLSVAVVAAGFVKRPEVSAILGAIVGAVITAQRAFPFGQRASFYRLLIGQSENLTTRAVQRLWTTQQVVDSLSTMRLDYAQELPRGTATLDNHNGPPPNPLPGAVKPALGPAAAPEPAATGTAGKAAALGIQMPGVQKPGAQPYGPDLSDLSDSSTGSTASPEDERSGA